MKRFSNTIFCLIFILVATNANSQVVDVVADEAQADETEEFAEEQEIAESNDEAGALEGEGTVIAEYGPIGFEEFPSIIDGEDVGNDRFAGNEEAFNDFGIDEGI